MTEKKPAPAKEKRPAPKPRLTDAERHERFVEMAHEVQADESPEAFDKAFGAVITTPMEKPP